MRRILSALVLVSVLMSAGCQDSSGNDAWPDDARLQLAEKDVTTGGGVESTTDWTEVTPGVWERWRSDGGFDRMGYGVEGLQFALEQARQERVELLERAHAWSTSKLNNRLRSNQDLLEYLQRSMDEARESGLREELPIDPPTLDPPTLDVVADSYSLSSSVSGDVCAGYYGFEINFIYGMADGWVDTTASWSEFGPFAPFSKTLYTYASAWHEAYGQIYFNEDEDSFGPFGGTCCAGVQSGAGAYPTFAPMLYGRAYLSVTNGCSAFRFYESANY